MLTMEIYKLSMSLIQNILPKDWMLTKLNVNYSFTYFFVTLVRVHSIFCTFCCTHIPCHCNNFYRRLQSLISFYVYARKHFVYLCWYLIKCQTHIILLCTLFQHLIQVWFELMLILIIFLFCFEGFIPKVIVAIHSTSAIDTCVFVDGSLFFEIWRKQMIRAFIWTVWVYSENWRGFILWIFKFCFFHLFITDKAICEVCTYWYEYSYIQVLFKLKFP